MSQTSDTESISSFGETSAGPFVHPAPVHSAIDSSCKGVLTAIHSIGLLDVKRVTLDAQVLKDLSRSVDSLSSFLTVLLDDFPSLSLDQIPDDQLFVIKLLSRYSFLERVFKCKAILVEKREAKGLLDALSCMLMRFLAVITSLTAPDLKSTLRSLPSGLRHIQERAILQSIKQLADWETFPEILGGRNFAPTSQRCVLQLLFVVHVLGPQIGNDPPPQLSNEKLLTHLYYCIDNALNRHSFLLLQGANSGDQETVLSMFICLFASVHSVLPRQGEALRPRSFGLILELITRVLGSPFYEPAIPLRKLNPTQALLLTWGNIIPWTWTVWQDQRTADSEVTLFLTSTWLLHSDTLPGTVPDQGPLLEQALNQDLTVSANMVIELLHSLNRVICVATPVDDWDEYRPTVLQVLNKSLSAFIHLRRRDTVVTDSSHEYGDISACCEYMLGIFCYLDDHEDAALDGKDLILEALSLVEERVLSMSIQAIVSNKATAFLTRLDGVIASCNRLPALPVFDKFSAERLALTLNFVHLIWTADVTTVDMFTGKLLICRVIQASLDGDQEFDLLRASMVSAASSIADNKFADAQQVRLEALILRVAQSPDDLSLACALALFILRNRKIKNDTLLLTTWDYLRNTFSGILSGKYLSEARPLALVISSAVCHALFRLATYNSLLERFTSSSPWTLSLAHALELLLNDKGDPEADEYTTALRNELQRGGSVLLSRISGGRDRERAAPRIQLVYCRGLGSMVAKCVYQQE